MKYLTSSFTELFLLFVILGCYTAIVVALTTRFLT